MQKVTTHPHKVMDTQPVEPGLTHAAKNSKNNSRETEMMLEKCLFFQECPVCVWVLDYFSVNISTVQYLFQLLVSPPA